MNLQKEEGGLKGKSGREESGSVAVGGDGNAQYSPRRGSATPLTEGGAACGRRAGEGCEITENIGGFSRVFGGQVLEKNWKEA